MSILDSGALHWLCSVAMRGREAFTGNTLNHQNLAAKALGTDHHSLDLSQHQILRSSVTCLPQALQRTSWLWYTGLVAEAC